MTRSFERPSNRSLIVVTTTALVLIAIYFLQSPTVRQGPQYGLYKKTFLELLVHFSQFGCPSQLGNEQYLT